MSLLTKDRIEVMIDYSNKDNPNEVKLGINIEKKEKMLLVNKIVPGGLCDGKLKLYDEITHIDGLPLAGIDLGDFIEILKTKKGGVMNLAVDRVVDKLDGIIPPDVLDALNDDGTIRTRSATADERVYIIECNELDKLNTYNPMPTNYDWSRYTFKLNVLPGTLGLDVGKRKFEDPPAGIRIAKVRSDSMLYGKVKEGDWIRSVDALNLQHSTVHQFSELLKKSMNSRKILTIDRWTNLGLKRNGKSREKETNVGRSSHVLKVNKKANPTAKATARSSVTKQIGENPPKSSAKIRPVSDTGLTEKSMPAGWAIPNLAIKPKKKSNGTPNKSIVNSIASPRVRNKNGTSNLDNDDDSEMVEFNDDDGGAAQLNAITDATSTRSEGDEKETSNSTKSSNGNANDDIGKSSVPDVATKTRDSKPKSNEKCEICGKGDYYLERMMLQTCSDCKISVHEDCYGLSNQEEGKKYPNWKCHACASVGKTVKVRRKKENIVEKAYIKSRPKSCALCSIKGVTTAMHPLFGTHGSEGMPIPVKKANKDGGIVWVHTLCALVINTNRMTRGYVYGCDAEGHYESEDESSDSDAVKPPGILDCTYRDPLDNSELLFASTNHFVINEDQTQQLNEFRELKCQICKNDTKSTRIPIQCHFKGCLNAFHVGCLRWGSSVDITFFPGLDDVLDENDKDEAKSTKDVICHPFCKSHYKIYKKDGYQNVIDPKDLDSGKDEMRSETRGIQNGEESYVDQSVGNDTVARRNKSGITKRQKTHGTSKSDYYEKERFRDDIASKLRGDLLAWDKDENITKDCKSWKKRRTILLKSYKEHFDKKPKQYEKCIASVKPLIDDLDLKYDYYERYDDEAAELESSTSASRPLHNRANGNNSASLDSRNSNRWTRFLFPEYRMGNDINSEADSIHEISESEMT